MKLAFPDEVLNELVRVLLRRNPFESPYLFLCLALWWPLFDFLPALLVTLVLPQPALSEAMCSVCFLTQSVPGLSPSLFPFLHHSRFLFNHSPLSLTLPAPPSPFYPVSTPFFSSCFSCFHCFDLMYSGAMRHPVWFVRSLVFYCRL